MQEYYVEDLVDDMNRGTIATVKERSTDETICEVYGAEGLQALARATRIVYLLNLYADKEIVIEDE